MKKTIVKKIGLTALCVLSLATLTTQPAYRYRGQYPQTEQKTPQGPHKPSAHQERRKQMEERRKQMDERWRQTESRIKTLEDTLALARAQHDLLRDEVMALKATLEKLTK